MEAELSGVFGTLYRSARSRARWWRIWGSKRERIGKREAGTIKETKRAGEGGYALAGEGCDAARRASRDGAHAMLEETGEKREKRRREYPTTDDIIGASLPLSSHPIPTEVLLSVSLLHESDFFHSSRSPNSRSCQENRMLNRKSISISRKYYSAMNDSKLEKSIFVTLS